MPLFVYLLVVLLAARAASGQAPLRPTSEAGGDAHADARRPNLVVVLLDDQHFDVLGAAGTPHLRTTTLDRPAREGVYFRQAAGLVSRCAPSRAVLYTFARDAEGYVAGVAVRRGGADRLARRLR